MRKLILVRHGQTEWNIERRYQGQTDTDMTAFGRQQLAHTADMLQQTPIDRLVTSPLKRAHESAEIVAARLPSRPPIPLRIEIEERFREMHLGSWEGESYNLGRSTADWFKSAPHGGETGAQFRGRILDWLSEQPQSSETVLLVVHGLVVQVILSILLNESFNTWHSRPIRNGALTVLTRKNDSWRLNQFNSGAR